MASPRVCILRAPGTNCDHETAYAFDQAGGQSKRVHLLELLENPAKLKEFQILCIPGGFSYGDDIGAGVIFSSQLRRRLSDAVGEFLQGDTLALGICNGFQTLLKAGLLPAGTENWPATKEERSKATLTWNENGQYTALWVHLNVQNSNSVFLKDIDRIELPIAHAEGRIVVDEDSVISNWESNGQIALRYTLEDKESEDNSVLPYPVNPNGSTSNIAGLSDPTGRILGLMPHPERFLFATHHPQWTRKKLTGEGEGMKLFRNGVAYF